ncbi:hypothetical protein BH11BAC6_BH11BAC6_04720 [soil metagenome]
MHLSYMSFHTFSVKPVKFFFTFLVFFATCNCVSAQEIKMNYKVKKGDKVIGAFSVFENTSGTVKTIKLQSHINTSFVVDITVDAAEQSVFQNGTVIESSIYRKVNGNIKANKKHRAFGNGYIISATGKTDTVYNRKITYNLMCLYATEPVNITKVYADNYEKFLAIKKDEPHSYRVDIPDGSYNVYFYANGKCTKVEIHQSLYTVTMVLS